VTARPYTVTSTGLRLAIRLTPRAAHNRMEGVTTGADGRPVLQVRLTAPPVEGAANAALIAFLADAFDLRQADVIIRSGQKGRVKIVDLVGSAIILQTKFAGLI
jgi:uncharacterized protein (TIGR00251 family)